LKTVVIIESDRNRAKISINPSIIIALLFSLQKVLRSKVPSTMTHRNTPYKWEKNIHKPIFTARFSSLIFLLGKHSLTAKQVANIALEKVSTV